MTKDQELKLDFSREFALNLIEILRKGLCAFEKIYWQIKM